MQSAINTIPGLRGLQRLARQAAANATVDVQGALEADVGTERIHLLVPMPTQLQCFEILDCWKHTNPPPKTGASQGKFWVCNARPVTYLRGEWAGGSESSGGSADPCDLPPEPAESSSSASGDGSDLHTYWDASAYDTRRLFWAVSSPEDEDDWQKVLYPLFGIGQWVWAVFDYQSDVWRVIQPYDSFVRFRLLEQMNGCSSAEAVVIGYPCEEESESLSSSSGESSSSVPSESESVSASSSSVPSESFPSSGSGCASGIISSSAPSGSVSSPGEESSSSGSSSGSAGLCLLDAFSRGHIIVHDPQGIVNVAFPGSCVAPACMTGWAKRCADSQRFEVVSYGATDCSLPAAEPGSPLTIQSRVETLETWKETYGACIEEACVPTCASGSGESSSSACCLATIGGLSFDDIPEVESLNAGDFMFAIQDGCLVKVAVTDC